MENRAKVQNKTPRGAKARYIAIRPTATLRTSLLLCAKFSYTRKKKSRKKKPFFGKNTL